MKILLCFILFSMLNVSGSIFSQSATFDLAVNGKTVKEVFKDIESQSDFRFLYNDDFTGLSRIVSFNTKDRNIDEVLNQLLVGAHLTYRELENELIVITPLEITVQQHTVSGNVTDAYNNPLPGVTVVVKGTTIGTITDANGNYSLSNVPDDAILVFSFVGMKTHEIAIDDQDIINLTMEEDVIGIEEVVAVGYGTRQIGDITGSIASVSSTDIQDLSATTVGQVLQGTVSGVTTTRSHTPGGAATIRVRGLGTINNNDPLWVVDGVPGAEVNPNNIESISVLKDASAQAIYGARGANGVILVTTKTGRINQPLEVNVSYKGGFRQSVSKWDLCNTEEYAEQLWLSARNEGLEYYSHPQFGDGPEPDYPQYIFPARGVNVNLDDYDYMMRHENGTDDYLITELSREGTDWQDVVTQNAQFQEASIDLRGGSGNTQYSFGANFLEEEGILIHTSYKRYNLRPNITFEPVEWLKIGGSMGVTYSEDWGNQRDNRRTGVWGSVMRMVPFIPVFDVGGNPAGSHVEGGGNTSNPYTQLFFDRHNRRNYLGTSGNTYADLTLREDLVFRTLLGFNYNSRDTRNINYVHKAMAERSMYDGLSESDRYGQQLNWTNTLEYQKNFSEIHDLTILAGTEAVTSSVRTRSASVSDFFSRSPDYMQLNVGSLGQSVGGTNSEWKLFSLFSRVNYDLDNKYLFAVTVRRDGSSRFGRGNRYGVFPAFSLAWVTSEENFMAFSRNWLNYLKFRGGWGQSGNDQMGNYNYFTTYASRIAGTYSNTYYPIDGESVGVPHAGFAISARGNPDVRWETTETINLGVDVRLFNNIYINIDGWRRRTTDMLYPVAIPHVVGYASVPSVNIGIMNNRGFDISLDYRGYALNQELTYSVGLNVSRYTNEIEKLSGEAGEFVSGGIDYAPVGRAEVGSAFPEFYGYIIDGIFQTEEEAANHPPAFGEAGTYNAPGRWIYRDVNNSGVITDDDRTYIGSPHPDFTAGFNGRIRYKGFTLSTRLYSSYGHDLYNGVRLHIDFNRATNQRSTRRLYESWGSPYLADNKDAKMAIAEFSDAGSLQHSTYSVEDASYLRMENLRLGYNLAEHFSSSFYSSLLIFGQIDNVFTITNYSGLDPEVSGSGISYGIDYGSWPSSRLFTVGVSIDI